jgi:hypothetical protein
MDVIYKQITKYEKIYHIKKGVINKKNCTLSLDKNGSRNLKYFYAAVGGAKINNN